MSIEAKLAADKPGATPNNAPPFDALYDNGAELVCRGHGGRRTAYAAEHEDMS